MDALDNWEFMFTGVQKIARSAAGSTDGFQQLLAFAAANPDRYSDPEYRKHVAASDMPFDTLKSWAKEGLDKLANGSKWSLLTMDCGDCPEILRITEIQRANEADFNQDLQYARSQVMLNYYEQYPPLYSDSEAELTYHNVAELDHSILNWTNLPDEDWHEDSGYLLWLTICTLALADVLRDTEYCRKLVQHRGNILVISGYEEIFFYVGTISATGFQV